MHGQKNINILSQATIAKFSDRILSLWQIFLKFCRLLFM